ncbi:hypothetical protein DFH29DRAFT_961524 [Suillus ampliporus]|nr:hypothetical protein DFH29DRAFT_961524 [Suillus ampliporus]
MPESIFGSPSHLLTAGLASGSVPTGNGDRMPTPVHPPPPSFADIHFGTIGKPPNLLSRISAPDPDQMSFRSPSPMMLPLQPPVATRVPVPNSRKLAERIQMGPSQINSSAQFSSPHPTREPLSGPRINRNRYIAANSPIASDNLIPPIVFLPTASESNMPPPDTQRPRPQQIQALANEIASANKVKEAFTPELAYPASLPTTPTIGQSNHNISLPSNASGSPKPNSFAGLFPQPTQSLLPSTLSASHHPNLPTAELSSSQVPVPGVTSPEASPQQVAQDSLSAIYLQLQAKSDALAFLALPTLPSRTPSPFAAPSNISQLAAGLSNAMNTEERGAIILRHPYPQSSSTLNGTLDQELLPSDDSNALALTCSQTTNLPALRTSHLGSLVEAAKQFQAVAGAAAKLQLDAERAFEVERMDFEERRKAFEEHIFAREAEYQAQMQAVQKHLEELCAREERLVALEEESRLREEKRRARDAQRRARDDQRKFEDESRRTAIQEEIAEAMKLLEEVMTKKTQWQGERERAERDRTLAQNNAPPLQLSVDSGPFLEKEDGMTADELEAVDSYNKSLRHRDQLIEKLKKQIAWSRRSFDTLQHMKETRLQAAEAERQRVADEAETQIVQAEEAAKRAHEEQERRLREQALDKPGQQGQQPPVAVGGERLSLAALLAQQSAHDEAQLQNTQVDTQAEYSRLRAQVLAAKQRTTSENAARIHAERAGYLAVPTTDSGSPDDMDVEMEVDELASPAEHTVPLPGQKSKPASRTKKTSRSQVTSGNVMLGTPSATTSQLSDGPPASSMSMPVTSSIAPVSYKTPSFVSASTEVGRQVITYAPLYPTQLASELHLSVSPSSNGPHPAFKNFPFPTTPKSRTILPREGSERSELTFVPDADLSPAQRDANLRHIKRNRHRVEESAAGDRSVKRPDDALPIKMIKMEEVAVGVSHDQEQTSIIAEEGVSAQSTDTMVPIQNANPPPAQAVSNANDSQPNDIPQTFAELAISQAPNVSARIGNRVDLASGSGPNPEFVTTRSPDPWVMDASVDRQEWTAGPVSPHSDPSESAHRYDPEQRSRQNSQISGRTRSPESPSFARSNGSNGESRGDRRQRQQGGPRYSDHYPPPPASGTSSHSRHLEQNETGALHSSLPLPPHPVLPMKFSRKRPAERNNDDDRDRRRPRYEPERDRDYRNPHGLGIIPKEWRRGRSTSPESRGSMHDRPRSPSPSRQNGPQRDTLDRRGGWNEGSYKPDYTNTVDPHRRPSDTGYSMEERPARREERDARDDKPSLLGRISTPGERGHLVRGRGRGRGDGRGRGGGGGRGRAQPPFQQRPLEERIG